MSPGRRHFCLEVLLYWAHKSDEKRRGAKEERIMRKGLTEIVFILDRSGSMNGLESDTIGGFNGMISRQKATGEKVNV